MLSRTDIADFAGREKMCFENKLFHCSLEKSLIFWLKSHV